MGRDRKGSQDGFGAEKRFAESFIRKNRRDRLLYELTDPDKRYDGLSRFCHQARDLLDPSRIIMEGEDLERRKDFLQFIHQHDGACLILSPDGLLDGISLPLSEAIRRAVGCFDAVIILGDTFAVVYGEVMKGGRGKFLLSETGRDVPRKG